MLLQEGSTVYVIDDRLEILEKTRPGVPIDFEVILHNKEKRRRVLMSVLTLLTLIVAVGFIVLSALIS
jgi:predicted HTH transcriptional regulator